MFLPFFQELRKAGVPVSLREFLGFLEGLKTGLATYDVEAFYYLARITMVKDERNIDKFDRAFAAAFKGLEKISLDDVLDAVDLPEDWLRKMAEKHLTPEERAEKQAELQEAAGQRPFQISGVAGEGIPEVLRAVHAQIRRARKAEAAEDDEDAPWQP